MGDPLDAVLDPPPPGHVRMGDTIFLRTFHGKYIDVDGSAVNARWADKGKWQEITVCPPPSECGDVREDSAAISNGDTLLLRAHNGNFVAVVEDQVLCCPYASRPSHCFEFIACLVNDAALRVRGVVCIRSKWSSRVIDIDVDSDKVQARWDHMGDWQRLVVERHVVKTPSFPATPCEAPSGGRVATPQRKRRAISPFPTKTFPSDLTPSPPPKRCAVQFVMCPQVAMAC